MKKCSILFCAYLVFALIMEATPSMAFTVGGLVRQPLNLDRSDLTKLESVTARANEVTRDRKFQGAFTYRGVPLKTLLGLASVRKEESSFAKPLDLAVMVRNRQGRTAILSWGEIFYRNGADVLVAFAGEPVMPGHVNNCGDCHAAKVYEPAIAQLRRSVGFPKLVVTGDFFTDRNLEEIVSIDVVEVGPAADKKQTKGPLFSPKMSLSDEKGRLVEIGDLNGYGRVERAVKEVSEGLGYHGTKYAHGAPLRDILKKAGFVLDEDCVVLASSVDNYRVLVSYGELFLNPGGDRILVADSIAGAPLPEGKFTLFFPDDVQYDRTAKALYKIEVVTMKEKAKLFVVGVGCGDTNLLTLQAVSCMGKADVFVASEDMRQRFSKYMGDKPVLFDPFQDVMRSFDKGRSPSDRNAPAGEPREARRAKNKQLVGDALRAGKNVVFLEYGDPTIYGPWRGWIDDALKDRVEIVPGISAFNAANAMIRRNVTCKGGSLILTSPRSLAENQDLLRAVQARGDTVAIFMGLHEAARLSELLLKHYPPSAPLQIVYKAGYSNSARTVLTTVGEFMKTAEKDKELHLAMVYVGPCLK